jgi:integrase
VGTLKLTEKVVAALGAPTDAAQAYYWDETPNSRGFGVVVGKTGRKTFVVRGRVGGRGNPVKHTLGVFGSPSLDGTPFTVQDARIAARKILGQLSNGTAPLPKSRSIGPTLQEALDYHVGKMERGENRRGKVCSPRSIATLRGAVELHLADWLERPLLDLTADVLDDVRKEIEAEAERIEGSNPANPPGRAVANRLLANVSAIWRSYHKRYGLPLTCPVERLTPGALKARENRIDNAELPSWYATVQSMENPVRRDLQLVALFTGIRTDGVRSLRWDDLDFDEEWIHVSRAKGDRPYTVPMTARVREILERRQKENRDLMRPFGGDGGFVFPSTGRDGKTVQAVAEVKERRVVRDAKGKAKLDENDNPIRETYLPGVQACRKTYNSVAIEIGVPREIRERLMNHEGRGVNVKSYGFAEAEWSPAREWADKIEAALWERIEGQTKRKRGKLRAA